MSEDIRQELLERYQSTGKIGFVKPKNEAEAYAIISTLSEMYDIKEEQPKQEITISLSELTEKLKEFLNNF